MLLWSAQGIPWCSTDDLPHNYSLFMPNPHLHLRPIDIRCITIMDTAIIYCESVGASFQINVASRYVQLHPQDFKAVALSAPMHQPEIPWMPEIVGCAIAGAQAMPERTNGELPTYAGKGSPYTKTPFADNKLTHSQDRYEAFQSVIDKEGGQAFMIGGPSKTWVARACELSNVVIKNAHMISIPILVLQAGEDIAVTADGQNSFCDGMKKGPSKGCASIDPIVSATHSDVITATDNEGGPVIIKGAYHELLGESDLYRIPALKSILSFFKANQTGG